MLGKTYPPKECYLCGEIRTCMQCCVCNLDVCSKCYVYLDHNRYCKDKSCIEEAKQYLDEQLEG